MAFAKREREPLQHSFVSAPREISDICWSWITIWILAYVFLHISHKLNLNNETWIISWQQTNHRLLSCRHIGSFAGRIILSEICIWDERNKFDRGFIPESETFKRPLQPPSHIGLNKDLIAIDPSLTYQSTVCYMCCRLVILNRFEVELGQKCFNKGRLLQIRGFPLHALFFLPLNIYPYSHSGLMFLH